MQHKRTVRTDMIQSLPTHLVGDAFGGYGRCAGRHQPRFPRRGVSTPGTATLYME